MKSRSAHVTVTPKGKVPRSSLKLLVIVGLLLVGLVGVSVPVFVKVLSPNDKSRYKAITNLQKEYLQLHDSDDRWRTTALPRNTKLFPMAVDVVWKRGEEVRKLLSESQGVSEDTQMVWNNFKHFVATLQVIMPDGQIARISGNPTESDKIGLRENKQIAFMPRELLQILTRSGSPIFYLCWRSDYGISIVDIEWPPILLCAALYHELYHGSIHPVGSHGYFKPDSFEYGLEEMMAHRIESQVMNVLTKGKYYQHFDKIIARAGRKADIKDVVSSISIDDMREFDRMIGMERTGFISCAIAFTQHVIGLGQYCLEKRGASKEEQGALFQWLSSRDADIVIPVR